MGCDQKTPSQYELMEGEMFLKLIDFGPEIYTHPLEDGSTLKELFESIPEEELTKEQIDGKKHYELLAQNDLLDKPYFNFVENNSDVKFVKVFLSDAEFSKIKDVKLSEIRDKGKKVKIEFYGKRINEYIIECLSIEEVKEVVGSQQWKK